MGTEVGGSGAGEGEGAHTGANGGAAGTTGGGSKAATDSAPPRAEPRPPARSGRGWKVATVLLTLLLAASLAGNALLLRSQRELEREATGLGMSLAEADARADRAQQELGSLQGVVDNVHRGIVSLQGELNALAAALVPAEGAETPQAAAIPDPGVPAFGEPAGSPADLDLGEALDIPEQWGLADPDALLPDEGEAWPADREAAFDALAPEPGELAPGFEVDALGDEYEALGAEIDALGADLDALGAEPLLDRGLQGVEPSADDPLIPDRFELAPELALPEPVEPAASESPPTAEESPLDAEPAPAEIAEAEPAEEESVPAPPLDVFSRERASEPPAVAAPRADVVAPDSAPASDEPAEAGLLERAAEGTRRAAEQVRDVFSD